MGLTIHYQFQLDTDHVDNARVVIEQLHQIAQDLPFEVVSEIVDLSGEACDSDRRDAYRWLKIQAERYLEIDDHYVSVPPTQIVGFFTNPGEGSESANFGLCRYPEVITVEGRKISTNLQGWSWQSFCKTQYASDPRYGGLPNFVKAHLLVVTMLDVAQKLGILESVFDEGDYWESRDQNKLIESVNRYNQLVAGMVGALSDAGQDVGLAPILEYPNFEHIEARGQDQLREFAIGNFKTSLEGVLQTLLKAINDAKKDDDQ